MSSDIDAQLTQATDATPLSSSEFIEALHTLEKAISAPHDSLGTLALQDDWSFIIKAHALIEGSVTYMLSSVVDSRLANIFAQLELGKKDTGKLEFTSALHLLTKEERGFIRVLSSLRNALAHDVRYLGFDLKAHITGMDKNQRKAFFDGMLFDIPEAERESWRALFIAQPKIVIMRCVMLIATHAVKQSELAALNRIRVQLHLDYVKELEAEL